MNGTAFGSTLILTHTPAFRKGTSALNPHHLSSTIHMCKCPTIRALSSEEIPPNALRRKRDPNWRGGFSLGVDLGMSRTGLALSKGFSIRPPTVLELRGQKLELRLIEIAERQEVDEFIIGLPKSCDGKETQQSNKVRSVAGRFAVRAAERCLRRCSLLPLHLPQLQQANRKAVGVGSLSGTTAASAAAIRWVSKDGIGVVGRLFIGLAIVN